MSDFDQSFRYNMDGLGLPAPQGLFGTFQAAVGSTAAILGQIDKLGKTAPIGEIQEEQAGSEAVAGDVAALAGRV